MSRRFIRFSLFLFLSISVFALYSSHLLASGEGKKDKEIDLPIEKPNPMNLPEEDKDKGPEFYGEELDSDSDSIVFVVDFSCSMTGSRIAKAKAEVAKAINSLTKNFKFSVVTYGCDVLVWQQKLVDASDSNKASAAAWVAAQNTRSATATGSAVKKALELDRKNKLVVLLTDGAPNCLNGSSFFSFGSEQDHLNLILSSNTQRAKVDVFAIEPYSSSYRQFCQDIAQKTGGKYKEIN